MDCWQTAVAVLAALAALVAGVAGEGIALTAPPPTPGPPAQFHLRPLHPQMVVHEDIGVLPCSCLPRREGE
jgi:hypothetical protein